MSDTKLTAPATSPASAGSAREKFQWGMRVKMTVLAIGQGMNKGRGRATPGSSRGIVIGFGKRDKAMVKIITENTSTGLVFHMDFWEADEPNMDLRQDAPSQPKF